MKRLLYSLLVFIFLSGGCSSPGKISRQTTMPSIPELGEEINSIVIIAGKRSITKYEIEKTKKITDFLARTENRTITPEEFLIEKAIVEQICEEESIIVNEERLRNEIDRRRLHYNIPTQEMFRDMIEKETHLSFEEYKELLRYQIKKQLLIQIRVPVPQPEEKEIEEYYRKNQKQIGMEVLFREIIFPKTFSISDERKIYAVAKEVHARITKNPQTFADVARTTAENVSRFRKSGGLRLWTSIVEIAQEDPVIAGAVYNLPVGSLSPIFKNNSGQYTIIKVEGKRPTPIEKVRDIIRMKLYYDKVETSFQNWLQEQKSRFVIRKI